MANDFSDDVRETRRLFMAALDAGHSIALATRIANGEADFPRVADPAAVDQTSLPGPPKALADKIKTMGQRPSGRPIHVRGMYGIGDAIHQRAAVRQLMERGPVELDTCCPDAYWDLVGDRLKLAELSTTLRTQTKQAKRSKAAYSGVAQGRFDLKIGYTGATVRKNGGVLAAMLANAGLDPNRNDFSLPIKPEWTEAVAQRIETWAPQKPLMVVRPIVVRKESMGVRTRNPDPVAYRTLFEAIRGRFFVVSVADLAPDIEWIEGGELDADVKLHAGELSFGELAALFARASLVFINPGFGLVLAQAVGAKHVAVYGGYERAYSFSAGQALAEQLAIEPIQPCDCFKHGHDCQKAIDVPAALERLERFVAA